MTDDTSKPVEGAVKDAPELAFTRLTPPSTENAPAIIFLHGAESCHLEFTRVATFLQAKYDLFLVDLPAHSRSKHIPFSFDNTVNGLVRLIRENIRAGRAHIAGLSLGGFLALEFARRQPSLVLSHPRLLSGIVTLAGKLATEKIFWATLGGAEPIPGLRQEVQANQNMATLRPVYEELAVITTDNLAAIDPRIRVAIVAGGKLDNVDDTRAAGVVLRKRDSASQAFVVRNAIHWWSLQFPELFAGGIRAWIERKEMPKEYEALTAETA